MNSGAISQFLLLVLAVGITFGYTQPTWEEVRLVQDDIYTVSQALENAERNNAELRQLLSREQQITQTNQLDELDELLPNEVDALQTMADIVTITELSDVQLLTLTQGEAAEGTSQAVNAQGDPIDSPQFADFPVTIQSTYDAFKTFVRNIERNDNFLEVASLSFGSEVGEESGTARTLESSDSDEFIFSLVVRAYAYQPRAEDNETDS